jgi:hypothetical protein
MHVNPQTPSAGKVSEAALPSRLDQVQRELAVRRAQVERSATITLVVGLVLLLLLAGYFTYGYVQIKSITEPKQLVAAGTAMFQDYAAKARPDIEKQIIDSAPGWAKHLSDQLIASMPDVRKQLEGVVLDQVTAQAQEAQMLTSQHFESFLKDNRGLIETHLRELSSNEKLTQQSLKQLQDALEKSFEGDMQSQAHAMLQGLESLSKRVKRLAANKGLTHEEDVERRLCMLVQRMRQEKIDPVMFEQDGTPKPGETQVSIPAGKATPVPPGKRTPRVKSKSGKPED